MIDPLCQCDDFDPSRPLLSVHRCDFCRAKQLFHEITAMGLMTPYVRNIIRENAGLEGEIVDPYLTDD